MMLMDTTHLSSTRHASATSTASSKPGLRPGERLRSPGRESFPSFQSSKALPQVDPTEQLGVYGDEKIVDMLMNTAREQGALRTRPRERPSGRGIAHHDVASPDEV